jgi:hypothetical protein
MRITTSIARMPERAPEDLRADDRERVVAGDVGVHRRRRIDHQDPDRREGDDGEQDRVVRLVALAAQDVRAGPAAGARSRRAARRSGAAPRAGPAPMPRSQRRIAPAGRPPRAAAGRGRTAAPDEVHQRPCPASRVTAALNARPRAS